MPDLASPLWLLGLAVVPLIRWLHRWRAPLSRAPVSALFLWKAAATESAGTERRQTPDPAWRRRALIASLLVLALSVPYLPHDEAEVTVWIDDTLSMETIDTDRSRLATGLQQLRTALDESGFTIISLRSLSDHARSVSGSDEGVFGASFWLSTSPRAADPPPPALMSASSSHWLLTDGASRAVTNWSEAAPLDRVISVGSETENVAITRLAARRASDDTRALEVLIAVANQGREIARRELLLGAGSGEHVVDSFELAPGDSVQARIIPTFEGNELVAMLRPGDALAADDVLHLDTMEFRKVAVFVDAACPPKLLRAVKAHPGLRSIAAGNNPELQFLCSDVESVAPRTVRFHRNTIAPIRRAPAWLPAAGALQNIALPATWISASTWPGATTSDGAVLVAGDDVLVTYDEGSAVETIIDMAHAEFVDQPEYAAVVGGLVDLALGRPVLDPIVVSARDPLESTIAPSELAASSSPASRQVESMTNFADFLLALALLVVLFDLFVLWRAKREARHA